MNIRTWLLAFVMGVLLPGLLFSAAEKLMVPQQPQETTPVTQQQTKPTQQASVDKLTVAVLNEQGTVKEMDMDVYLTGVLLGEMPTDFDIEALKAQAVVARTYALKRCTAGQKHSAGAVCTESACCQGYQTVESFLSSGGSHEAVDKVSSAVESTAEQVLTYHGALIEATYFSCSGGRTEDAVAVWGTDIPYLQAVDSPGEEKATHFADSIKFTAKEFTARLGIDPAGIPATWFGEVTYTQGGGVDTMVIAGKTFKGTQLRQKLGLRSTAFFVLAVGDSIHVTTKGFGHRVGMSQYGAEAMAVSGSSYQQILSHYYPGTQLVSYQEN